MYFNLWISIQQTSIFGFSSSRSCGNSWHFSLTSRFVAPRRRTFTKLNCNCALHPLIVTLKYSNIIWCKSTTLTSTSASLSPFFFHNFHHPIPTIFSSISTIYFCYFSSIFTFFHCYQFQNFGFGPPFLLLNFLLGNWMYSRILSPERLKKTEKSFWTPHFFLFVYSTSSTSTSNFFILDAAKVCCCGMLGAKRGDINVGWSLFSHLGFFLSRIFVKEERQKRHWWNFIEKYRRWCKFECDRLCIESADFLHKNHILSPKLWTSMCFEVTAKRITKGTHLPTLYFQFTALWRVLSSKSLRRVTLKGNHDKKHLRFRVSKHFLIQGWRAGWISHTRTPLKGQKNFA